MDALHQAVQWSLLYDFYGSLLTEHQAEIFDLYHGADLSLGEIADQFGISRQAVYDNVKRAERTLLDLEERLGLVSKHLREKEVIMEIGEQLRELIQAIDDEPLRTRFEEVHKRLTQL